MNGLLASAKELSIRSKQIKIVCPKSFKFRKAKNYLDLVTPTLIQALLHMFSRQLLFGALALCLIFPYCSNEQTPKDRAYAKSLFVHEVYPIIERKCQSCHGEELEKVEGGFQLISRSSLLRGGQSGLSAVVPGEPDASPLISYIERHDPEVSMPPKEDERLNQEEIDLFRQWITLGAPWPDKTEQQQILALGNWQYGDRIQVQTSGGLEESWDKRRYKKQALWAFYPLQAATVPSASPTHPIDAFIEQELGQLQLKLAEPADKLTLLRRASFDLTGLPPTKMAVEEFLADDSQEAFDKVLERLLQSPHYGEQWGKHWLDVVRYADSDGFSNDYMRPNAWRYRDYVIRSFNEDKPYSDFIREQIAGDELDQQVSEYLIATGFLRMGPWEHTGMAIAAETRQLFLDDVTNIVGETFLSLPLGCAKCHDHKYDPIPTKDYYRIQAVFAPTQFADRVAPFLPIENRKGMAEEQARIVEWIERTKEEREAIREKREQAAKLWFQRKGRPYLDKWTRRKLPADEQPPRYIGLTFQDLGYRKVLEKRGQILKKAKLRFEPYAFSVYNGPNKVTHSARDMFMPKQIKEQPPATFILSGGSVYSPKEEVQAGVLSALTNLNSPLEGTKEQAGPVIPSSKDGRRLAFANWLTEKENPLVIRSIVNRIWQYHFGRGLVESSNNFGGTGKRPSHPELLDWLCHAFIQQGWSIKALHRLIMSSQVYQQSSQPRDLVKQQRIDPDNIYLSHFPARRLSAEEVRDAMLMASGELNLTMGGIPVRPEINQEIALQPRHTMGSIAPAYQPSRLPTSRNRRTIYAEKIRNLPDPILRVFNQPSTEISCERRNATTVSPQVFSLLNSPQIRDRAIALAIRLQEEAPSGLAAQLTLAGQLSWNRALSTDELSKARAYVLEMQNYHEQNPAHVVTYPKKILRKIFEEMTGEPFEYDEELDIFHQYKADKKDADVSPSTRALADLVLVLFNTNEFLYVY